MNSTTTSEQPLLYMRPLGQPLLSFALLFLPLIIVATTVGNSLVIRAIFTEKCLQHVQNYPLASLAVADLLTALLVMSQGVVYEVLQYWPLNKTLCYMWIVMDVFLCTASILNMCLIGIDRYLAISRPLWYAQLRTPPVALVAILAAWGCSALVAFPPLLGWINLHFKPVRGYFGGGFEKCDYPREKSYVVYSTVGSFGLPLLLLTVTYCLIYKAARKRIKKRRDSLPKVLPSDRNRIKQLRNSAIATCNENAAGRDDGKGLSGNANDPEEHKGRVEIHERDRKSSNTDPPTRKKKTTVTYSLRGSEQVEVNNCLAPDDELEQQQQQQQNCSNALIESPQQNQSAENCGEGRRSITRSPNSVVEFVEKMEKICIKQERRAAIVLAVVVILFLICWTPFFAIYVFEAFLPLDAYAGKRPQRFYAGIVWLGYLNSTMNPFVYSCMNKNFRTAFSKILKCKTHRQNNFRTVAH